MLADFVNVKEGTGCVHIAPGHGEEDYSLGLKYKLSVFSPVDNEGKLISLMDQMLKSQKEFGKVAAILVDINKIPDSKIREYITEFEKKGIKIILKKTR